MINTENSYQTFPMPDGTCHQGLFDSIFWFDRISRVVDFQNKTVLDVGCNQFSYGIQALTAGASYVTGVDSDPLRVQQSRELIEVWNCAEHAEVIHSTAEDLIPDAHDIVIFSMIIHWLRDPEQQIKKYTKLSEWAVFIYRVPGFDTDTGYLPSVAELDALMGRAHWTHEVISDTPEQNIRLTIYKLT